MIVCWFENRFGLQDPTTISYMLQLIKDSVVIAHVAMGTLKLLQAALSAPLLFPHPQVLIPILFCPTMLWC